MVRSGARRDRERVGTPTSLAVTSADWEPATDAPGAVAGGGRMPDGTAARRHGTATDLRVPARKARVLPLRRETRFHLTAGADLPGTGFVLECDPPERALTPAGGAGDDPPPADEDWAYVRFRGPARVEPDGDAVVLTFPERRGLTVGVRTGEAVAETVTVAPTAEGVATAVEHSDAALGTTDPARATPAARDHPPRVAVGDRTDVPRSVRRAADDTGVSLHLPDSPDAVFAGASLAHYLGASVTVGEVRDPRLSAPGAGVHESFDADASLGRAFAALLRRVTRLERAVHRRQVTVAGPDARDGPRVTVTEETERTVAHSETTAAVRGATGRRREGAGGSPAGVGVDDLREPATAVADRPLAARLAAYLEAGAADGDPAARRADPRLPPGEGTLVAADPDPERARSLPHLLDTLTAVEPVADPTARR